MDTAERVGNEFTDSEPQNNSDAMRRERSMIEFPYSNLEDAEHVAVAIFEAAGMSELSAAQAGAAISVSSSSSTFRVVISAAKMFGFLSPDRGVIRLTELGQQVAHENTRRVARIAAFLRIPLYKALTDRHDGRPLPPPAALEREMAELGVAAKQTPRARQTFDRSARHAGFIKAGSDILLTPVASKFDPYITPECGKVPIDMPPPGGHGGGGDHLDPLVAALIKKLPPAGAAWPCEDRVMWLQMAAMAFRMAYSGDEDQIDVRLRKSNVEQG